MDANTVLATWRTLNEALPNLSEDELFKLINKEQAGQRRTRFLDRIYGRYNLVRALRERRELFREKGVSHG